MAPIGNMNKQKSVVILGNAYGKMPYQDGLCEHMRDHGYEVIALALSGQVGGEKRPFNIKNGVLDLEKCLKESVNFKDVYVIAHCATSIILNEFLSSHPDSFKKAIFYSPLCHPASLKGKVEDKFSIYNLSYEFDENEWNYDFIENIKKNKQVPFKIFVIKDKYNKHRCNTEDGINIVCNSPIGSLEILNYGYDVNNKYISSISNDYVKFIEG